MLNIRSTRISLLGVGLYNIASHVRVYNTLFRTTNIERSVYTEVLQ